MSFSIPEVLCVRGTSHWSFAQEVLDALRTFSRTIAFVELGPAVSAVGAYSLPVPGADSAHTHTQLSLQERPRPRTRPLDRYGSRLLHAGTKPRALGTHRKTPAGTADRLPSGSHFVSDAPAAPVVCCLSGPSIRFVM